jgi:hypothetical protein
VVFGTPLGSPLGFNYCCFFFLIVKMFEMMKNDFYYFSDLLYESHQKGHMSCPITVFLLLTFVKFKYLLDLQYSN